MANSKNDWEDIELDDWEDVSEKQIQPTVSEEMGAAEAALTGFGQGASFGLTPIVAGLSGAAGEVVEDIGDVLGLTEDAKLREKGFEIEDEYKGLQGLLDAYYAQRDRQIQQEQKAMEDQPVATLAGGVAGGVATMGGLAKAPTSIAKFLPKAESLKGLSAVQKAGVAAREGAKAGALAGFGAGESKLAEGEVLEALGETAATGAGGALFGAGISGLGSGLGATTKAIKDIPLIKNIQLGYTAGKKGIDIADDNQISEFVRSTTSDIRKEIAKRFKGANKKALLQEADEIGIRVSAGETIEEVIDDIKKQGAFGKEAQKELNRFVQDLKALSNKVDPDLQKAVKQVEKSSAKSINKILRQGGDIKTRTEFETPLEDITPFPETKGRVVGVEDRIKLPTGDEKKLITQAAIEEPIVPLKQYDLENMTLSELDDLTSKIGTRAFEGKEEAIIPYAKKLYAGLRELGNDALNDSSLPERNKKLKALFDGLESLGIKPKDFFSSREVVMDEVKNKIQQKLTASPLSASDNKMQNFLKYLGRADEELAESIKKQSEFTSDIAKFVRQSEGEGSVSLKAAVGPVQKVFAKIGNIVGLGAKSSKEAKQQAIDYLKGLTPKDVQIMASELSKKYGEKASPYINQLNTALNAPNQRKTALLYSAYQQPAFRKMLETVGKEALSINEARAEEMPEQGEQSESNSSLGVSDSAISEPKKKVENKTPGIDLEFLGKREGYSTEGYIPVKGKGSNYTSSSGSGSIAGVSGVTIAGGLDLGQRKNLDDLDIPDSIKEKLSPYLNLKKEKALDKLRKVPLNLTKEEAKLVKEATEESYYNQVRDHFNSRNKNARSFESLPDPVKTALYSLYYNQGSLGPKTIEKASNDDDYTDLIEEFRNYYTKGSKADKGFQGERRKIEADYMENMLKKFSKYKNYNRS